MRHREGREIPWSVFVFADLNLKHKYLKSCQKIRGESTIHQYFGKPQMMDHIWWWVLQTNISFQLPFSLLSYPGISSCNVLFFKTPLYLILQLLCAYFSYCPIWKFCCNFLSPSNLHPISSMPKSELMSSYYFQKISQTGCLRNRVARQILN